MGKKHFCFFQTAETWDPTSNSSVKGGGANHYPRAPAHHGYVGALNVSVARVSEDAFKCFSHFENGFFLFITEVAYTNRDDTSYNGQMD